MIMAWLNRKRRDGKSTQLQHAGCIQFSCLAPLVTYFFTPELDLEISLCVCEKRFQPNFICSGSFFQGPCHNSPTSAITKQVFGFYAREQQTQMTAAQTVMLKDLLSLVQPKNGIIADHYILLHIWTCTKEMTHLVRCQTTRKLFN